MKSRRSLLVSGLVLLGAACSAHKPAATPAPGPVPAVATAARPAASQPAATQPTASVHAMPAASMPAASAPPISVTVVGAGRPMILIPGLGCGPDVWQGTVAHYKSRYTLYLVQIAGFAGAPPMRPLSLRAARDAILSYIAAHHLDHPVIVGHSLGGFLAYWIAETAPGAVGPVIAVDGVPFLPGLRDARATIADVTAQAKLMRDQIVAEPAALFVRVARMSLQQMISDPKEIARIAPTVVKSDQASFAEAFYELATTDLRPDVGKITTPVLQFASGGDPKSKDGNKALAAAYDAEIAKVRHHTLVVADTKHFIMLDDPAFFFAKVDAFLARHPG